MAALRRTYAFTGFYLPGAPDHPDPSWKGTRSTLEQAGWGVIIIYVGRQNTSSSASANQGSLDGKDAVQRTKTEGFAAGSVIFLDVEFGDALGQAMLDYVMAWFQAIVQDGTYRPGVYCHIHNFPSVQAITNVLGTAVTFWICGGSGFSMASSPSGCGFVDAVAWQGWLDSRDPSQTVEFLIDVNLATSTNPSAA
jgi:hypothetical protein